MARKLLIGLGVVVAILAVALIALIAFVDVNRFKPQIEQAVRERFDRQLAIQGDLALTVFPRLGVALPRTTLSERGSSGNFASIDGARVSVALLPLLGGRIEAGTISVYGLDATIERRADGTTSIDDLIGSEPKGAPGAGSASSRAPAPFEIGGVELSQARLTFRDLAARNTITLTRLSLTGGRLAPTVRTPVDLSTQFSATRPALQGELKLRAEADLDLPRKAYGGRKLDLVLKATLDKRTLDLAGKAATLRFDGASGALGVEGLEATGKGEFDALRLDESRIQVPALAWDPMAKRLSLGGLVASARGSLDGTQRPGATARTLDVKLAAPKIQITEAAAAGERVTASLKLGGAPSADVRLALEGFAGSAAALKVERLALDATVEQPLGPERTRRIAATITSPATANLDAQTVSLGKLAGHITMEDPALSQKSVKLPVTGRIALDAKKELVDAGFSTRFDDTTLSAEFDLRGFAPARLSFEASADRLDLDRYFPPTKPAGGHDGADTKEDPAIDLSILKDLNLAGEARVGQLQARGIRLQNLRVVARAADGRMALAPITSALYGGSIQARAFAQADNRLGIDAALTGVDVQPLLKDALGRDLLAGRGDVKLDLVTGGATVGELKRGLNGSGALTLRDGAVKGIDVEKLLRGARKYLSGGQTQTQTGSAAEKTDFSTLSATFAIKDGVARGDDLDLQTALIRVRGAGTVDLPAASLDYTVRATVIGTPKGQDLVDLNLLQGVTVPVTLSGPFEKLSYSVDWGAVARDALRSNTTGRVRERLGAPLPADTKPLGQRASEALKGLLGK
jgi:AsmA protein